MQILFVFVSFIKVVQNYSSLKKIFKRKSILKTLRRDKNSIMNPAGFIDIRKKVALCLRL